MNLPNPMKQPTLPRLKLTRAVEGDPRCKTIELLLSQKSSPLWEQSVLKVPHISLHPSLENTLKEAFHRKQVERGLEHIGQLLANELKGLIAVQKKQNTQPSFRVSRLLIVANDGSQRFYRDCEKILLQNSDRLLVLQLDVPSSRLSEILLGVSDKPLKALLVSDRDAVSAVLFALVENKNDESI